MRTEKTVYSAPKAKCFEVNVQGVFCQSYTPNFSNNGTEIMGNGGEENF